MVDVLGHLGMALLWLAPSWYVFDRGETAAAVVGTTVSFGMLPDVDLVVSTYVPSVDHHGAFHTIFVVSVLAALVGPLVGVVLQSLVPDSWDGSRGWTSNATLVGIAGVWIAGLSHLFADVLSAPDVSQPLEPLWPLYDDLVVSVDVVWYSATWVNVGLFVAGIAVHAALWYWTTGRTRTS